MSENDHPKTANCYNCGRAGLWVANYCDMCGAAFRCPLEYPIDQALF